MPEALVALEMTGGVGMRASMEIMTAPLLVPMALEAVSSTEKVPSVVGVPLIKPVVRLIERPGGRLAAVKEFAPLSAST